MTKLLDSTLELQEVEQLQDRHSEKKLTKYNLSTVIS